MMKKHSANTFRSIELSSQEKKKTVLRKFLPQNSATAPVCADYKIDSRRWTVSNLHHNKLTHSWHIQCFFFINHVFNFQRYLAGLTFC